MTIGGNIRLRMRGGMNDMKISRKEQMSEVPEILCSLIDDTCRSQDIPSAIPYASGQGSRVTVPSAAMVEEQVPSAYIASNICTTGQFHPPRA